jgi:hypothetical protein
MGSHRGSNMRNRLFLLIFFLVGCSSGAINSEDIATDSELIWCLSQETMVDIGSISTATGWDKIKDYSTNERWSETEVVEAKKIYNTLITTIDYYDYIEPNKTHPDIFSGDLTNTKDDHKRWLTSVFKDGKLYGNSVDSFFYEMKTIKTEYETDEFFNENKDYNQALKENRRAEYINSHSICKLWYEVNN